MGTLPHSLQVTASILHLIKMQFLLLAGAVLAGVSGFSFNRNDECPTVQDGVTAFEDHFGTQIPDGLMDCVLGGDNCPFEDFAEWFETTTGISMPERNEEDLEVLGECLTEGTNCPSLEDLHDFVQEEFGYNPSDEEIAMIENCAESWLQQLGVNI